MHGAASLHALGGPPEGCGPTSGIRRRSITGTPFPTNRRIVPSSPLCRKPGQVGQGALRTWEDDQIRPSQCLDPVHIAQSYRRMALRGRNR